MAIDSRIVNLKKIAVSSSNSSLLKQYKQHSSNLSISSTGSGSGGNNVSSNVSSGSMNLGKQRSSSTANLNNKY